MNKLRLLGAVCACFLLAPFSASASVIDFEGFASGGVKSDYLNETIQQAGFDIIIQHGHIVPVDHRLIGSTFPDNGTDWFEDDFSAPVEITKTDGGIFSAISFDASETHSFFARNITIDVTGIMQGGLTITTSFITDDVFGFETLLFDSSWNNLVQLNITNPSAIGAYDNIVLASAIPIPAAAWLFGSGLLGLVGIARRKKQLGR